jgi:8-oxo-dGTP pyrophosphatase MutT (NUDIX family)
VAFPGGRQEKGESDVRRLLLWSVFDFSQRETAEREVHEEVGLSVRKDFMLLGRLDDIRIDVHGSARTMVVSAFVYLLHPGRALELKLQTSEVAAVRWVPVSQLLVPHMASLAVPIDRIFSEVPLGQVLVACSRGFGVRIRLTIVASLTHFAADWG